MKLSNLIIPSLVLCILSAGAQWSLARNSIAADWRAYYPDACPELQDASTNAQSCILCHSGGFNLNPYGQDLADNDNNFALVGALDSDGDGRTNDEEILIDCTLPGDMTSPVDQDSWGSIKVLFR